MADKPEIDYGWRISRTSCGNSSSRYCQPRSRSRKVDGRGHLTVRQWMVIDVLRTGCLWKALPRALGAASTVHDRYQLLTMYFFFWHLAPPCGLLYHRDERQSKTLW